MATDTLFVWTPSLIFTVPELVRTHKSQGG